jgi:hypothetical protein
MRQPKAAIARNKPVLRRQLPSQVSRPQAAVWQSDVRSGERLSGHDVWRSHRPAKVLTNQSGANLLAPYDTDNLRPC